MQKSYQEENLCIFVVQTQRVEDTVKPVSTILMGKSVTGQLVADACDVTSARCQASGAGAHQLTRNMIAYKEAEAGR